LFNVGTLDNARPQQAGRAEHQHRDQHEEREHVLVMAAEETAGEVADVARAERFDQSQQQAAQHRPAQIADAAQHRGREGLEAEQKTHVIVRQAVIGADHDPGYRGQRRADHERGGDHPVDVDAHQARHLARLRGGGHGPAEPGFLHHQDQ